MSDTEGKYGKRIDYDPLWKGPMQNIRFPTDRIWLIVFSIYLVIYIAAALFGFIAGDVRKLGNPSDYAGRECGIDKEVRDKPFILYMNLKDLNRFNTGIERDPPSVCVSKCPTENFIYKRNADSLQNIKEKLICVTGVNVTSIASFDQIDSLVKYKKCAEWYLKSTDIQGYCVNATVWKEHEAETASESDINAAKKVINGELVDKLLADTKRAIPSSITSIIIGGLLAIAFMFLLRWYALPFFYACICMFCAVLLGGIYYLIKQLTKTDGQKGNDQVLFLLILLVVLVIGVIIAVIYFRKKIYLACRLIKESSKAIIHLPVTLAFPIFPMILYLTVIIFAIFLYLSLSTITSQKHVIENAGNEVFVSHDSPYRNGSTCDPISFNKECNANLRECFNVHCRLASRATPKYVYLFHAINIFGVYWLMNFISGLEYMILGGTFGTWYWTHNKDNVRNYALVESTSTTFRYHLGTIAIGSLILTIVQIIRMLLKALHDKLKESDHPFLQALMCCFRYIFDIFEQILSFITCNAYIMCAIHGKSFCQSAKSSYHLIMRNLLNVMVVNQVVELIFFMATVLITCIVIAGIFIYSNFIHELPIHTLVIGAIGTCLLASVFFSVQTKAVDTVFLCFVEDSERNDGSDERPYYMSAKLRKLLEK